MAHDDHPPGRLGGIGQAFSDRNFRIYSVGSIASWISFFVQIVAVDWLAWKLTGSTTWLAVIALLDIVPNVVLTPFAGALADRYDRHKILLATCVLALLQSGALAALAFAGLLTIWPLAILVLMHGIIISFMVPAMYGTLPRFVERKALTPAIAVSSAYTQFAVFAGPALAGWIIVAHSLTAAFVVNALGYAILLVAFLSLRTPKGFKQPPPSERSLTGDIADGFAYIWRNATFSALMCLMLVSNALVIGFYHMLPAYSDLTLDMGVVGVSTILAFSGIGATVAALWLAHGGAGAARVGRALWSSLIAMLALAALVLSGNIIVACVVVCLMGFASETLRTSSMAIIQLSVDENQRGRVMGTLFMLSQLATGIGAYAIGTIATHHGLQMPVLVGVGIGVLVWAGIFLVRRRLMAEPER